MKTLIVIPAYNEERRIGYTLEEYCKFFKSKEDFEILVVINNTTDKTEEIVKKAAKKHKEIRYLNFEEGGKGFAIKKGFEDALERKVDLIGFVDADMATPPEAFYDLIKNIEGYDGIIASRYVKGAVITKKQPLSRIIVSRIGNFVIRILFLLPYHDTQAGAKVFKKEAIKKIFSKLSLNKFGFDVDLLYQFKKAKLKVKEFPTVWDNKEGSTLNLRKASAQVFLSLIKLRFKIK